MKKVRTIFGDFDEKSAEEFRQRYRENATEKSFTFPFTNADGEGVILTALAKHLVEYLKQKGLIK